MKRFKNILFVTNPELKDTEALERVISLADNNQARLTVVSIVEKIPAGYTKKTQGISLAKLHKTIIEQRQSELESLVTPFLKKVHINVKVLEGKAFLVLIQEVLRDETDLLIKTVEKKELMDRLFGSTDMHLLRKCPCPVWLMKASKPKHYKNILAAVDFDPSETNMTEDALNLQLLEMSFSLALAESSELDIVHVWYAYGENKLRYGRARQPKAMVDEYVNGLWAEHQCMLDELVIKITKKVGKEADDYLKPNIHLVKGIAQDVIPELVKEQQIDLVVMGTVGRTGVPGFIMGNTAETILNRIDCSVLALKPEGFVTPIKIQE